MDLFGRIEEEEGVKGIESSRARLEPEFAATGMAVWSFDPLKLAAALPLYDCIPVNMSPWATS